MADEADLPARERLLDEAYDRVSVIGSDAPLSAGWSWTSLQESSTST